jgi:hypothetical protein
MFGIPPDGNADRRCARGLKLNQGYSMPCMAQCRPKATKYRPSYDTEFLLSSPGVADRKKS